MTATNVPHVIFEQILFIRTRIKMSLTLVSEAPLPFYKNQQMNFLSVILLKDERRRKLTTGS